MTGRTTRNSPSTRHDEMKMRWEHGLIVAAEASTAVAVRDAWSGLGMLGSVMWVAAWILPVAADGTFGLTERTSRTTLLNPALVLFTAALSVSIEDSASSPASSAGQALPSARSG